VNARPEQREQAIALMREHPHLSDREIARQIGVGNKTVSRWRSATTRELEPVDAVASKDLCALISEHGVRMTERRLRRWRQAGYLVPLHRTWIGKESTYIWSRDAVEQGIEIDRLLHRYGNGEQALVGLFSRGYGVDGEKLMEAYGRFLARKADDLEGVLRSLQGIFDHPDDDSWNGFAEYVLERFAHGRSYRGLRRMRHVEERKLAREQQSSPAEYVETAVQRAALVFLRGRLGTDSEIREMLQRSSFESSAETMPIDHQVELSKRIQARMSLGALARVLDTVPVEQLARTRDDALSVLRVYEGIFVKPLVHRTSIAETYPEGLVTHWLRSDPFMFGFLLLYFQSIRFEPTFKDGLDDFVETTKELLPELDEIVEQLMWHLDKDLTKDSPSLRSA
jgi:hypothetical protein